MVAWKDKVFDKWWPLGQSLVLVRAGLDTAGAIQADCGGSGSLIDYNTKWIGCSLMSPRWV